MASPPFSLNVTIPGDTDIVSQFPGADRTHIDTINSWLLINHNTQGRHAQVDIDQVGTTYGPSVAPTPGANISTIYRDTDGGYKIVRGDDSTVEWLGVPPGTVIEYSGSTVPTGYLAAYGQAVSRTTYARLFTAIGTLYGAGDGSTTFNLPDHRGRVAAGKDDMGGSAANRIGTLVTDSGTIVGTTLGSTGGSQNHGQASGEVGAHAHSYTDPTHAHQIGNNFLVNSGTSILSPGSGGLETGAPSNGSTQAASVGITINATPSPTAMAWLQPTIIVNKLIKY